MRWDDVAGNGPARRQGWNLAHTAVDLTACSVWCWHRALVLVCGTSSAPKLTQLMAGWLALCCAHYIILLISLPPHGSISSFPYSCLCPFSLFLSYLLFFSSSFWLILLHSFIRFFLFSLIYLFRVNFQIYKPITAKRLCWGSLWACRCGGSWIPITELIWKKTLSVMWKWFGLRLKFIIITLISSQASALAAAKENTKA